MIDANRIKFPPKSYFFYSNYTQNKKINSFEDFFFCSSEENQFMYKVSSEKITGRASNVHFIQFNMKYYSIEYYGWIANVLKFGRYRDTINVSLFLFS